MMNECARYDTGLFYTLKPGAFTFANVEFASPYKVNEAGLRDDHQSLLQPAIITLGDSFTMGWGVGQGDTFASILEEKTGLSVLNAGISSYGTARELKLLERLNMDSVKWLIIQYHDSDRIENQEYLQNQNNLQVSSETVYEETKKSIKEAKRGYFGKRTALMTKFSIKAILGRLERFPTSEEDAVDFLNVLLSSKIDLSTVNIIVFDIESYGYKTNKFSSALEHLKQNKNYPSFINNIKIINPASVLSEDDYFILDDHVNANGHLKISELLLNEISE